MPLNKPWGMVLFVASSRDTSTDKIKHSLSTTHTYMYDTFERPHSGGFIVECVLPITLIHSLYHPPHPHHSGMSPPGVWPLEGDPLQLPPSVGYDHPEDWVGHGQYSTQPTTCTNELNVNELNVGGGVLLGCMCVCVQ